MTVHDIAVQLPSIDELRQRCRVLAVLDEAAGGGRFGFVGASAWMRTGSGDEWNIVFTEAGAFIRVFDHESAMSPYDTDDLTLWPGLVGGLPEVLRPHLTDERFTDDGRFIATAVLWRQAGDDRWHTGAGIEFPPVQGPWDLGDGSWTLEILLDGTVDRFVDWAEGYYERPFDRSEAEDLARAVR